MKNLIDNATAFFDKWWAFKSESGAPLGQYSMVAVAVLLTIVIILLVSRGFVAGVAVGYLIKFFREEIVEQITGLRPRV